MSRPAPVPPGLDPRQNPFALLRDLDTFNLDGYQAINFLKINWGMRQNSRLVFKTCYIIMGSTFPDFLHMTPLKSMLFPISYFMLKQQC